MHYINSDVIRADEIPKFKRDWMAHALELIDPELLQQESVYRSIFNELFEEFRFAMKKCMLDYILRAPMERARLHIELIPRPVPCSAERIGNLATFKYACMLIKSYISKSNLF
jgi:hypothetical protein